MRNLLQRRDIIGFYVIGFIEIIIIYDNYIDNDDYEIGKDWVSRCIFLLWLIIRWIVLIYIYREREYK